MDLEKLNGQIAKIGALANAMASEIINSDLRDGEKFLLLQRIFAEIAPSEKAFKKTKKSIEDYAKENAIDRGDNQSEPFNYEGAEVLVKFAYPKAKIDGDKLIEDFKILTSEYEKIYDDYVNAMAKAGEDFDTLIAKQKFNVYDYYIESTTRKTVTIQTKLNK